MLKKIVLPITLLFCLLRLNAQEKSNMNLKIEPGFLLFTASENLGLFLNVEPRLKSSKNSVIGLRFGATVNSQKIENYDSFQYNINEQADNGVISFVPTFDYYLNRFNFHPYLGLGVGYYLLATYIEGSRIIVANPVEDIFEVKVNNQVGILLRGGAELGRLIIGLEYNFVPKADIEIPNGQTIGTVDNSYLGLSIGFTIGGRINSK